MMIPYEINIAHNSGVAYTIDYSKNEFEKRDQMPQTLWKLKKYIESSGDEVKNRVENSNQTEIQFKNHFT